MMGQPDLFSITVCREGDTPMSLQAVRIEIVGVREIVRDDIAALCAVPDLDDGEILAPILADPFTVIIWDRNGFRQQILATMLTLHGPKNRRSITWEDLASLAPSGPAALRDILTQAKANEA